ncbi:hypothetical protein [Flammeovirga sp. SJP92]|uniref:hypothetical protein n=1 Tax=Flammeovirga sp. SJP92 TaxID=1775430 RepID=UPI000789675E|nr:hypothetical protein [Flammeovirga sp. SJP92]KXX67464.1 hypothetical protein AVL50_29475 [Flammeovirga sp. SJP92]
MLACLLFFVGCTKEEQEQIEDLIPELSPVYEVYKGNEKVMTVTLEDILNPSDQETWEVIQLTYGDSLTFKDISTEGEPTGRSWSLNGNKEEVNAITAEVTVIYNVEGEHVAGEVTFIREGGDHPDASIQTEIPLKVNVSVPVLLPAFKVMMGDSLIYELKEGETVPENTAEWAMVELTEGAALSFINTTNQNMFTSSYWLVDGVDQDSVKGNEVSLTFATVGEFNTHQLLIERVDGVYPDVTTSVSIPVTIKVIEEVKPVLTAGVKVFLASDKTTPLYTIAAGENGEEATLEIDEGTTLVFEAEATEGTTLAWSVNNGSTQTSSASSFEVLFEEVKEGLGAHTLTLSKDEHETVEIQIPLTIKVNQVVPELLPAFKVMKGDSLVFELKAGETVPTDQADWASVKIDKGESLSFINTSDANLFTSTYWFVDGMEEDSVKGNEVNLTFATAGEFNTHQVVIERKESNYPDLRTTVVIPLTVEVVEEVVIPELIPTFKVMNGDQLVYELKEGETIPGDTEEWATVELDEGDALSFINTTNEDLFTSTYWVLEGVEEDTLKGNSVEGVFKTEGEYIVHELVIERKDAVYPDLTEKVVIPVKVQVKKVDLGPQPPKASVQVFLSTDLETPIYEIPEGKVGEGKSIAIEKGTTLLFKTQTKESPSVQWTVNNGTVQTSTATSFEVPFDENNDALTAHKLTLSKEGFEDVEILVPLSIEVFTSEALKAGFSIYKNDDLNTPIYTLKAGEEETATTLEINQGDRLTFVDQSTGQPTGRTWKINNGTEEVTSQETSFEVTYSNHGTDFGFGLMVERKGHEKFKDADLDYPSKVKVNVKEVQNDPTLKAGKVTDNGSGVLYFDVSHPLTPFTSAEVLSDFKVSIQNIEANYSNANASISEVKLADGNNKRIEIYLVENFFNSDDIQVEYTGNKIQSLLGVALSTFTAEDVEMNGVVSYLDGPMSDFETPKSAEEPLEAFGWYVSMKNPTANEKIERVTSTSSSGDASMHFAFELNSSGSRAHKFSSSKLNYAFAVEEGEYEISIDVFIPQASSAIDIIRTNISTNDDTVDLDVFANVPWVFADYPNMKYGEWVTLRQRISLKKITTGSINMNFKEKDMKLDGLHDFYLDNIKLRKVEARQ